MLEMPLFPNFAGEIHGHCLIVGCTGNGEIFPNSSCLTKVADIKPGAFGAGSPLGTASSLEFDAAFLSYKAMAGSNPLGLVETAIKRLKDGGVLTLEVLNCRTAQHFYRPVTALEHIYFDYKNNTECACHEHIIASLYTENKNFFPSPENIEVILSYLWHCNTFYLDSHAERLIHPANRDALKWILSVEGMDTIHHVFDINLLMKLVDLANSLFRCLLYPIDISFSDLKAERLCLTLGFLKEYSESTLNSPPVQRELSTFRRGAKIALNFL